MCDSLQRMVLLYIDPLSITMSVQAAGWIGDKDPGRYPEGMLLVQSLTVNTSVVLQTLAQLPLSKVLNLKTLQAALKSVVWCAFSALLEDKRENKHVKRLIQVQILSLTFAAVASVSPYKAPLWQSIGLAFHSSTACHTAAISSSGSSLLRAGLSAADTVEVQG